MKVKRLTKYRVIEIQGRYKVEKRGFWGWKEWTQVALVPDSIQTEYETVWFDSRAEAILAISKERQKPKVVWEE